MNNYRATFTFHQATRQTNTDTTVKQSYLINVCSWADRPCCGSCHWLQYTVHTGTPTAI